MARVKIENTKGNTKPRILLVVYNDLIRDIFRKLFLRFGYHIIAVDTARNGFKALNEVCLLTLPLLLKCTQHIHIQAQTSV